MATWVFVDDSDPVLAYSEGWTSIDASSVNATGVLPDVPRLAEDGTVHVILPNVKTASLAYTFTGKYTYPHIRTQLNTRNTHNRHPDCAIRSGAYL